MAEDFKVVLVNEAEVLRQLEKVGLVVKDVLKEATLEGAEVVREAAEDKAPGPHIEKDVTEKKKEKVSVDVGPDEDHWYYRFIEMGAQPHEISPKNAKALKLVGGSGSEEVGFAARVGHPGMAARPFLRPAVDSNKEKVARVIGDVIIEKLKGIAKG